MQQRTKARGSAPNSICLELACSNGVAQLYQSTTAPDQAENLEGDERDIESSEIMRHTL